MRRYLTANTCLAVLPFFAVLAPSPAVSQDAVSGEAVAELEEIVVTATRSSRPVASIPGSVIVIGEDKLQEQMRFTSDPATIISKLVPGFSVANQTMSGASETFRGRSILVMVDGVPRNTPLRDVSRTLSLIDLTTVERIEVVNGASSLYGSGATGGTINFITKKGEEGKPTVTVETKVKAFTGNLSESAAPSVSVTASQKIGDFDYFVSGSGEMLRKTFDGSGNELPSDAMLGQGGGDRTKTGNVHGRLGYEIESRRFEVSAELSLLEQNPEWFSNYLATPAVPDYSAPYTGLSVLDKTNSFTASYSDTDFSLGGLEIKAFHNDTEKRFPFTRFDTAVNNQVYYSGNPASPAADFAQGTLFSQRTGVNASVDTSLDMLKDGMSVTWGLDYVHDHTYQTLANGWDVISPMTQDSVAGFAQFLVPVTDALQIQAGARYERYFLDVEDFRRPEIYYINRAYPAIDVIGGEFDYDNWTFNVGATFDLTPELQAFGGFSQGFSLTDIGGFTRRAGANSSAELCDAYGSLACPGAGTPDYHVNYSNIAPDPQVVNNYEVGLRGNWTDFGGTLSAFLSTSENGVNYDVASNRVLQREEEVWGAEATGWWQMTDRFTLGTVLSYQEGRYDTDGDGSIDGWLPNNRIATPFRGLVYGTYVFENGLNLRGEVSFFTGRDKIKTVPEIEGAVLLNVLASKKVGAGELSIGIENLLDTDYMNPTASATRNNVVNGQGRTVTVGYKVTF